MASAQCEQPRFGLRNLTPEETTIAFLGMAHMLKQSFMRLDPSVDLMSFKLELIHEVKGAVMTGSDIRDEIAAIDTIIDLVEMAYATARRAKASNRGQTVQRRSC